ncbi:hypothetical protein M3223_21985 [Paenibacillus pasadenensis]|uniref:hypothetical protein n=1 Tax=Paenibacillus pasadenensis TaxID=217090 RepID=UPI00203AA6D4|nr:hypothetical protein [Paenibacillus pasadenensis]MCM3750010.1 hypothetical protein [Paenibacillus pasadenensis]
MSYAEQPLRRLSCRIQTRIQSGAARDNKDQKAAIPRNDGGFIIEKTGVYLIRVRTESSGKTAPLPCLTVGGSLLGGLLYDPPDLKHPGCASGWLLTRLTQGGKLELTDRSLPLDGFRQPAASPEPPAALASPAWEITLERVGD